MSVQLITIDFWNTLFDSSKSSERSYDRYLIINNELQRLGEQRSKEQIAEAQSYAWNYFSQCWEQEHRTLTTEELVHVFWQQLGINADSVAMTSVVESFANGILRHPPELLPGVAEALPQLATLAPLAIISDTAFSPGTVLRKLLQQQNVEQYFTAFSFSDETGVSKPHPKAYQTVLQPLNVLPQYAVHIGDIERTDIAGAKNLGMKAIRYEGDGNSRMNDKDRENSIADARLHHWEDILRTIEQWHNQSVH